MSSNPLINQLSLPELKDELAARNLDTTGLRIELIRRLEAALEEERRQSHGAVEMKRSGVSSVYVPGQPIKLFVGQIPNGVNEEQLRGVFSQYGRVKEVHFIKDRSSNKFRGCAFVHYETKEEADAAIEALSGKYKLLDSKRELVVRYAGKPPEEEQEFKLYVGMLSRRSSEEDVRRLFEPYGIITEVFLMRHKETGASQGQGFVKFRFREDAQRAILAMHNKYKDRDAPGPVQVRFAHTRQEKEIIKQGPGIFGNAPNSFNPMMSLGNPDFSSLGQMPPFGQAGLAAPLFGGMGGMGGNMGGFHGMSNMKKNDVRGPPGSNLFILNLPENATDSDLEGMFRNFGNLLSVSVQIDKMTGRPKGFGFVSYDNPKSAQAAIAALDGFVVGQKRLSVRQKKEGSGAPSGAFQPY